MSKVVKAVVGIGIAVAGFATGQVWLVSAGLSITASAVFAPKAPGQQERQASETTLQMG